MFVSSTPSSPVASQATAPSPWQRVRAGLQNQLTILVLVLLALYFYFGARNSLFFSSGEMKNLLVDFSGLVLLAIAETFVIISGGIDLSVGATGAVSGVIAAKVLNHYAPIIHTGHVMGLQGLLVVGTLMCIAIGLIVGLINAFLITIVGLVPFVATLVTLSAGFGYALVVSGGGGVGDFQTTLSVWSSRGFSFFTYLDVAVLVVAVILALVLRFARFGRYTYAIGSNPFAARAAGINVRRHIALVYIVAGFLGGLVGMYFLIRLGSGFPTTGENVNLSAIACVVIGGIALTGGSGSVLGTLLGCAILTVVNDGLIAINVPPTWNQVVVGVIIMAAAGLQALRGKLSLSKFFTTRSSGSSK